jgi:hypothetical protein
MSLKKTLSLLCNDYKRLYVFIIGFKLRNYLKFEYIFHILMFTEVVITYMHGSIYYFDY